MQRRLLKAGLYLGHKGRRELLHHDSMSTLLQDFQQSWRSLARQPLFAGMAVASLALGIGMSTVIFSVVYGLLLRPLPFPHPAGLVHIGMGNPRFGNQGAFGFLPPSALQALRDDPQSGLSSVGGFCYDYANLTGVPTPVQLNAGLVTVGYFRTYGVPPARGRLFTEADVRGSSAGVVILSDLLWRTQFQADENVLGRTISLADQPRTVIGIMPAKFKELNDGVDLWLPLADDGPEMTLASQRRFETTARLADPSEAGRAQLRAHLATLSARLARDDPKHYKDWHLEFHPLAGNILIGPPATRALYLLLGAVGCVLLVTCANVANLQLVRAASRRREIGVRLALGASRARIMRQVLSESLLLAAASAGLGALLAAWGVDAVAALLPTGYSPLQDGIRLSWPELGFTVLIATAAGILTGLLPAWAAARQDPAGSLAVSAGRGTSEGPGGTRVRAALVVAEIALALVLLAGAGLMGRSLLASLQKDAGARFDHTLTVSLALSTTRYPQAPQRAELLRRILEQVDAVPGVAGTALTDTLLFSNWNDDFNFLLPGQSTDDPAAQKQDAADDSVSPETFHTLGIPLRRGRLFDARDRADAPRVMLVNETFARKFLPPGEVVGRHLTVKGKTAAAYEIIGVVGDVRRAGLNSDAPAAGYFSYLQRPNYYATLYVRAARGLAPESLTRPVQDAIWRVDPDQPIGQVQTLEQVASASVAYLRLYTALFAVFAGLTLGLAALGIYGTIAYSVGLRTRELGIRLALGAQRGSVFRLVLQQGVWLVALGLVLGLGTAVALAHLMRSLVYGIEPTDPATLASVSLLLAVVALLAAYLPARRATAIDPLEALREE